ncbi:DoxX family membrane protein [Vibrio sonorensis]|uniref:DoxX family membrane protein n=1 Tax=Vibrio sonorensis TaxID=1004316 RepID=UPI0008D93ABA|nr:DoxX family membrane protein [Vibrio sonorensis]
MRNLGLPLGLICLAAQAPAHAHVKWFVDTNTATVENFQPYSITDTPVLIWMAIAALIFVVSAFLDTRLPKVKVADSKTRHDFIEILRIFTGMSFLLTAYDGALIAPHHVAYGMFGDAMVLLQATIGIMLLANRFIHHASILIVILYLGLIVQYGVVSALEYVNILGISLFLLFNNLPSPSLQAKLKPYSVDALRILTGLALFVLGVTEKLHGALYGQAFIADFQWNFMPYLGFEMFDDRLFVLSAGISECILGILLMMGTTTRLTTLTISGFMLTSNIVFIVQGNREAALMEFVGHLPIIGSALVLILLGYGQKLKVTQLFARS